MISLGVGASMFVIISAVLTQADGYNVNENNQANQPRCHDIEIMKEEYEKNQPRSDDMKIIKEEYHKNQQTSDELETLVENYTKNQMKSDNFMCVNPQPRSVPSKELDKEKLNAPENKIFPANVVLHRCDRAGCCSAGNSCQMENKQPVELVFEVIQYNSSSGELYRKHIQVIAQNHTKCSCNSISLADTDKLLVRS